MERYIFFTDQVNINDSEKVQELKHSMEEAVEIFGKDSIHLAEIRGHMIVYGYILGSDTNIGDEDLHIIFGDIGYTWIDARSPYDNNIKAL